MVSAYFNRNIPDECHQKIGEFIAAGNEPVCVAFAPGANRWSIVGKNGGYFNRNIPDECHQKMAELSKNGARIVCVAFPPEGGNRWSIVNSHGGYLNRNIPDECHQKMAELSKNGARIVWVAFPPEGGNRWSIVNSHGGYLNRNIPDECHTKMAELSKNGARIVRVAFPKPGGNRWSVINDKGGYFNRGIPDEAHMMMGFLAGVHGQVRHIAFDGDGSGWSILSDGNKNEKVCDQAGCVSIVEMYRQITRRLDGKVVGYACSLGGAHPTYLSRGQARTSVDGGSRFFAPFTKTTVASVSKFVTALVAIKVLAKNKVSLGDPIGSHLPPDWNLDPVVAAITFRELLSHRSGIKDYGNVSQEYDKVKAFFTQRVDTSKNTACQGAAMVDPPDAINANDKSPCYSNYNFAIFRILLPWIDGVRDNSAQRASKLADAFVRLAQQHVFEPVGAIGVQAKPPSPASDQAYSYVFPGSSSGEEWGDGTLGVGAAGWYLSIEDVGKVLHSLNRDDERILTHTQLADMEAASLGWDVTRDGNGLRWVEKNGGWGTGKGSVSTSVALMGPGVYGALFINSNISGESGVGADAVLHDAFVAAYQKR